MAATVNTGWRTITPGKCDVCGCSDDWDCDGRGTIYCSCQCCGECGEFDGHADGCSEAPADDDADQDATHWGYGSGMPGCLYDNGPHFCETQEAAIEAGLFLFQDDLSEAELEQARADLKADGIHYFPAERRGELGASLVEVWEEQGPCPDSDD